ncbi:hypothetical protein KJ068_28380 [bacterium]|nr:hypothetical protein [bacterium]
MTQKWYQKTSIQAAIIAGVFLVLSTVTPIYLGKDKSVRSDEVTREVDHLLPTVVNIDSSSKQSSIVNLYAQETKEASANEESTKSSSQVFFEVTLTLPSRLSNANIFVDDMPAHLIKDLPTLKIIRVKSKSTNHKISAQKGEISCLKQLFIQQNSTISLCD